MKNNQRGEIATIITLATLLVLGVSSLVSSVILNKTKQTTSTKAAVGLLTCGDNPEGAPAGFRWKADCNKPCTTNGNCDINPDRTVNSEPEKTRWCYGFANKEGKPNTQSD